MYIKADRALLKRAARDNMRQAEPRTWKVTLIFILLTTGIATLVTTALGDPYSDLMNVALTAADAGYGYEDILGIVGDVSRSQSARGMLTFFLNVLLRLYVTVMTFGYVAYTLRRTRGEEAGTRDLLSGFGMVGRVVLMSLIVFVFTMGWSFLVIFPLTMFLSFGLVFLSLAGSMFLGEAGFWTIIGVAYLFIIAGMVLVYFLALRYALSSFLLLDHPEEGALSSVRRSRELLRGRMGELFTLVLSFLGWNILQIAITVMVSLLSSSLFLFLKLDPTVSMWLGAVLDVLAVLPLGLWLYPYFRGTMAEYYGFLVSQVRPRPEVAAGPADDYHGPEPF